MSAPGTIDEAEHKPEVTQEGHHTGQSQAVGDGNC
jgi:hypothetical protein